MTGSAHKRETRYCGKPQVPRFALDDNS